jgi:hypothetical protein
MNANAVYSKSGKGVQEASGKTSQLSRPDRAVLSAIDGRATLADVAQKVGKAFDPTFEKLIETLDKGGFIREVSAGTPAAGAKAPAAAKPGGAPAKSAPMEAASDLDFTAAIPVGKPKAPPPPPPQAPPRAAPPPSKPAATIPPPPPPPSAADKAKAEQVAKQQQDAFAKAREDAEKKAQAERDRVKAEAEAKMRAETEAKLRTEAEAKAKADAEKKVAAEAEAKVKAARDAAVKAAAEAKAKADAEAKKAREEAERVKKEAEDRLRREQEEMKRKLEEERKAREEIERKAKEEARRLEEERKKLEEERRREEEERAARRKAEEEQRRKEEEERAARRKREEEEEEARRAERRKQQQEEEERERAEREAKREAEKAERRKREEEEEARAEAERSEREARRKAKQQEEDEAEARDRAEREAKRKAKSPEVEVDLPPIEEEAPKPKAKAKKEKAPEKAPAAKPAGGGGFSDSLLADLDSFTNREEEEQKAKDEEERKAKEEKARLAREAEERRQKEEAERLEQEEKERRKREEKERKAKEEAELREREEKEKQRLKDEEEKRKKEAEEREKKAKQDEQLAARSNRAGAFDAEERKRREQALMSGRGPRQAVRIEKKGGLGKPIALGLFGLVVVGLGVAHVMPIGTADYERAATDALGRPVKIGSANLSLFSGLQLKFKDIAVGDDVRIAEIRGFPEFSALTGPNKVFNRIEIDGAKIGQGAVGGALFAKVKAENLSIARVVAQKIEFPGPLAMPKGLDVDVHYDAEGLVRSAVVRGPEALLARLTPKGSTIEVEMSASSFTLPVAPEITLSKFNLKGTATPQALSVSEWDGELLTANVSGNANLRWGDTWTLNGAMTVRNLNAGVLAPALLSTGRGEGSAKFSMTGEPGKLIEGARLDGTFTITRGVLGSIDLSKAIQSGGKAAQGRTEFNEMTGQVVYDRGAIQLRNLQIAAGQLNAGATTDISASGALSGRIVADVRVASQQLRATLLLGGTVKEPTVRN